MALPHWDAHVLGGGAGAEPGSSTGIKTSQGRSLPGIALTSEVGDIGAEGVVVQTTRNNRAPPRSQRYAKERRRAFSSD